MTTLITRMFEDEAVAQQAASKVYFKGVPERAISVISGGNVDTLSARMDKARVHAASIAAYAEKLEKGGALLVVGATHIPLGAPRITRETLAKFDTVDMGDIVEEYYFTDPPEKATSILKSHKLFLTQRLRNSGGTVMGGGLLLTPEVKKSSAAGKHRRASRMFWPMPLLSRKERRNKTMSGERRMSRMFWPMPLLSRRERKSSVIRGGGPVFSRTFGWPTS
ncbi:hypothetical protein [Roseovarius sp. 2305UL8-3]|uniref:hypothetical protein n=1 Tax=Roseovarius conchicola TaxID=3121636 RepID=UPI0035285933